MSFDVVNAYVNAKLLHPIRSKCPEGYNKKGWLISIIIALYRLKESAKLWYADIALYINEEFDLLPIPRVNCLFLNSWPLLILYVDNIVITYYKKHEYKAI